MSIHNPNKAAGLVAMLIAGHGLIGHAVPVDFAGEIQPVLETKCLGCHNPNIRKGDVSLAQADEVVSPLGKHVIPGDPEASKLLRVVRPGSHGEAPEMPAEGEPLTANEVDRLARWIREGAAWPSAGDISSGAAAAHRQVGREAERHPHPGGRDVSEATGVCPVSRARKVRGCPLTSATAAGSACASMWRSTGRRSPSCSRRAIG